MLVQKFNTNITFEAGTDEAGRGCLAGPVVAAAVIFNSDVNIPELNDSKKLSEKKRLEIEPLIKKQAKSWAIGIVNEKEIDEINILNASILAMHKSLKKLSTKPEFIIVDGNKFKQFKDISHECIVKGDSKYLSIAAASILAKNERDRIMHHLHNEHPEYNWKKNKGYPTKEHRSAIKNHGSCTLHRKTFKLLPNL